MSDDMISRKAAIDAVMEFMPSLTTPDGSGQFDREIFEAQEMFVDIGQALNKLPSAQPKKRTEERTETHACDLISRQAAIEAHYEYCNKHPDAGFPVWSLKILEDLPSAQPDLSEYSDKLWKAAYERGKAEAQQRWIPFKRRKPTEEEWTAFDYIMDCKCPEDGQNILVSINIQGHEPVQYDTFYGGGEECCLESGYELVEEATAWMPLPEPYREEGEADESD